MKCNNPNCVDGFVIRTRAILFNAERSKATTFANILEICHDCAGTGISHCCEGLTCNEQENDRSRDISEPSR